MFPIMMKNLMVLTSNMKKIPNMASCNNKAVLENLAFYK